MCPNWLLKELKKGFKSLVKILGLLDKPMGKLLNAYNPSFQTNFKYFRCSGAMGME